MFKRFRLVVVVVVVDISECIVLDGENVTYNVGVDNSLVNDIESNPLLGVLVTAKKKSHTNEECRNDPRNTT